MRRKLEAIHLVIVAALACGWWVGAHGTTWGQDDLFGEDFSSSESTSTNADAGPTGEEAEGDLLQGETALANQEFRDAIVSFLRAESILFYVKPIDEQRQIRLYRGLTDAYSGIKDWASAQRYAEGERQLLLRQPRDIQAAAFDRVGQIYEKMGDDFAEDAQKAFRQAMQGAPNNPDYAVHLGRALADFAEKERGRGFNDGQESLQEALKVLNAAIDLKDDYAEAYYERGGVNLALRQAEEGIEDLQKAVTLEGENSEYLAHLGQVLISRAAQRTEDPEGKTSEIIEDYRNAIGLLTRFLTLERPLYDERKESGTRVPEGEIKYEVPWIYLSRGEAHSALAHELQGPEAVQHFRQVIADCQTAEALEPDDIRIRTQAAFSAGIAYRMLDDLPAALNSLNRAIRASFGGAPAEFLVRRGVVWYRLGDPGMAMRDFNEAADNGDPRAHFWRGVILAQRGKFADAVNAYTDALRMQPDYVAAFQNRGLAYMQLELYERAARDFEEILQRNPNHQQALSRRRLAWELGGIAPSATPLAGNSPTTTD